MGRIVAIGRRSVLSRGIVGVSKCEIDRIEFCFPSLVAGSEMTGENGVVITGRNRSAIVRTDSLEAVGAIADV